MSDGCGWGWKWFVGMSSRNGFRPALLGSMGDTMAVASAKRAVRGVWMVSLDESVEVRRRGDVIVRGG
jgi:hypothetical protein